MSGKESGEESGEEEESEEGESEEEESDEEKSKEDESEDAPERRGERSDGGRRHQNSNAGRQGRALEAIPATVGRHEINDHQRLARRDQEYTLEDSFIVTSLHHRPWGAGDDNSTIGVFPTEKEAEVSAHADFLQRCENRNDGWESEWHRCLGDGMLQLRGYCEDGEDDSESYRASIKRVQQKRLVAVRPSAPQPKLRVVNPRHVYVVKEEQRINVGEDDPRGFSDELGDLKMVKIRRIYVDLDAANDFAREVSDAVEIGDQTDTVIDTMENGVATFLVENNEEMMTWSISVEKRRLQ